MVKLDRLVLQGFKSFAAKTELPMPGGFIAVCGANGSGKSNIADSLTFVMGIQSARAVRAQKLQNLIFNGGRSRKPAEWCEVSLVLDNDDGKIPVPDKEVRITRRITRSGISVYKLNGKTVNKAKIVDVMSPAGLSPDGHNIIMQGDVTRLIEMNPKERRQILDDISGIAEFIDKKNQAVAKLEKVETRVNEALAVIAEKQRRVEQLKQEAEAAEKYQQLNAELRTLLASSIHAQLKAAKAEDASLEKETDTLEKELSVLDKEAEAAEKELGSKEKVLKSKADEIIKQKGGVDTVRQIERTAAEILRKRDKADSLQEQLRQLSLHQSLDIQKQLPVKSWTLSSVVSVPKEYSGALEVAIGGHAKDLIVGTDVEAVQAIDHLRENSLGRARFLPLNRIKPKERREIKQGEGFIGWAMDLISFDQKFYSALSYVLGNTAVVDTIENARKMAKHGIRFATLEGDLIEASGAMIGGHRIARAQLFDGSSMQKDHQALLKEIESLSKQLQELQEKEKREASAVADSVSERDSLELEIAEVRKKRTELIQKKFAFQSRINNISVEKARREARMQDLENRSKEYKDVSRFVDATFEELQKRIGQTTSQIRSLGLINQKAVEDYKAMRVEFGAMKEKLDKLLEEKSSILKTIEEVEKRRHEKFTATFDAINSGFQKIWVDLTGGTAQLRLEDAANLDSGLLIEASPAGKKVLDLDVMSGGEKTLTSLAFLFAIMQHFASPFYVLDEVDAALDKANARKVANLLKKYSDRYQFLVITHNDITTAAADRVFGVTMEEGASKVYSIALPKK
jgi:chromosome segregation protein